MWLSPLQRIACAALVEVTFKSVLLWVHLHMYTRIPLRVTISYAHFFTSLEALCASIPALRMR